MIPGRLVHKATDNLPPEAWSIMIEGFKNKRRYRLIAIALARAGFHICERTIARRGSEWRAEQLRREALKIALTGAPHSGLLLEGVNITKVLDVRPGWMARGKRRVHRAYLEFIEEGSLEKAIQVDRELLRYHLETSLSQMQGAGAGLELGQPNINKAGEAGGGI